MRQHIPMKKGTHDEKKDTLPSADHGRANGWAKAIPTAML